MKKYFENVFACTYAGYKQSEKDEPWKTDSVGRAITVLIIGQAGILIILATLCCKFFNIKIEDNTAYITFIVALLVVGIINSFYFTSERAEILYDKFCSKTELQRGLLRLLVVFHIFVPFSLSMYLFISK